MKRFNRSTARQHVNKTKPYRVTKQDRMRALKNDNYSEMMPQIDEMLKNILVLVAGTKVEGFAIGLINMFRQKLYTKILKEQKRRANAKPKKPKKKMNNDMGEMTTVTRRPKKVLQKAEEEEEKEYGYIIGD